MEEINKNRRPWRPLNRNIIASVVIIVLAIAITSFIYRFKPIFKLREGRIHPKLILNSNAQKSYDAEKQIDYAKFDTPENIQELTRFYKKKLTALGWNIDTEEAFFNGNTYRIFASKNNYSINILMESGIPPPPVKTAVTIHLGAFQK